MRQEAGAETPSLGLVLEGAGFVALEVGVICIVALGFASLTNSRPAAIVTLIGVDLLVSPILASITSLGSVRRARSTRRLRTSRRLPIYAAVTGRRSPCPAPPRSL